MPTRPLALTPDLVARTKRHIPDPGRDPDLSYFSDAEYASIVADMLAKRPSNSPLWLFACGSLIWKPEVDHIEEQMGRAHGWHRSFCFRITRFRGTPDRPGLMMAMDRGGQCRGVLYRLHDHGPEATLDKLFRREFIAKPPNNLPRWIQVEPEGGAPVKAIAFVMNRRSPQYIGRLDHESVADHLATACGHAGSGAEYLYNTVHHLAERGIYDRNLMHLQAIVARKIAEPIL
jgi:glutathione-specific gamma-glutamylcyclotransferase